MAKLAVCVFVLLLLIALGETSKCGFPRDFLLHIYVFINNCNLLLYYVIYLKHQASHKMGLQVCVSSKMFVILALFKGGKVPCCVTYQQDRIKFRFLKSYKVQEDINGCDLRAIM